MTLGDLTEMLDLLEEGRTLHIDRETYQDLVRSLQRHHRKHTDALVDLANRTGCRIEPVSGVGDVLFVKQKRQRSP
jgi:hypothetical protein